MHDFPFCCKHRFFWSQMQLRSAYKHCFAHSEPFITDKMHWLPDLLIALRFYVPLDTKYVILETFSKPTSWLGMEKQNLTQQKHAFTNQNKCTTTQNKHKKLKLGLVASYDIWPGNGEGLFWFWRFINLSLTYSLKTLTHFLTAPDPHTVHRPPACGTGSYSSKPVQLSRYSPT